MWGHTTISARIGVNPADTLPLTHLLAHRHLWDDVPVHRLIPPDAGGVVKANPLAKPGGWSSCDDGAVFNRINWLAT